MRRRTRGPETRVRGRRLAAPATVAAALALLAAAGCAKKAPPSGGPPDLVPPTIETVEPDSGAAHVPLDARISITFSEPMEPRATGASIEFTPPLEVRQRRWTSHAVTLVLAESLKADRTYTMFVGSAARDRHGNNLADPRTIIFTTADEFPKGRIEGVVEATGFKAPGTMLWCYVDGRQPDSTAKDFDALGVADATGAFRIAGLATGHRWRVWAFADLNHNRSYEPETDLLQASDSSFALTEEQPVVKDLRFRMVDERAPGRFIGVVNDTIGDRTGALRLIVTSKSDSTRRVYYEIPGSGSFDLRIDPGWYRVRAFRDRDRNKAWQPATEPASDEIEIHIPPGTEVKGVVFDLSLRRRDDATGGSP